MNMTGRLSLNAPPVPTICNTLIFSRPALSAPATLSLANRTANNSHFFSLLVFSIAALENRMCSGIPGSSPKSVHSHLLTDKLVPCKQVAWQCS